MAKRKNTPARQQYLDLKASLPDTLVLYRMGDFFECFDEDAQIIARELELTLTARSNTGRAEDKIPMAGVPHHAVEGYIARLVEKGYRVAVIDQMGTETVNGIVPRAVTQIVTPGTLTEPSMLEGNRNNYLMALTFEGDSGFHGAGIAYVDISTGEFATTEVWGEAAPVRVLEELTRLNPREVLMPKRWAERGVTLPLGVNLTPRADYQFDLKNATDGLTRHFNVRNLAPFGLAEAPLATGAAGGILEYLRETQRSGLEQVTSLRSYSTDDFMTLDTSTRRNLELTETMRGGSKGSLLKVLDRTVTPMGARLLRAWMGQPLLDLKRLIARLDAVESLYENGKLRAEVATQLRNIPDLERLTARLMAGRVAPRELQALAAGLRTIPHLRAQIMNLAPLSALYDRLDMCEEAASLIENTLVDDPPATLNTPGIIRHGVAQELDEVYHASREARDYIANLEEVEKKRTGLKTLKVSYNKVFGYYIEISRGLSDKAPSDYIRKQTLVNAERFITPEMKHYENIVLNAEERILEIERRLYDGLLKQLQTYCARLQKTARAVAHLDALMGLGEVAAREGYVRPTLTNDDILMIRDGRHPVVEQSLQGERFVPNDCFFDESGRIHLVTGPNMAGKSTMLRQVALIVLMAQIGSFVPADEATIGLVDRIFTRVGAQDEIHAGQSTFMVEMVETANILTHATPRSLVILDEIGRGTSTYDGMAIARAVIEYIHNSPALNCKTLFATHYHELTELENILPRVVNYSVAVAEEGDQIIFLHRVVPGRADRSYGVHVAQLAGVPKAVVNRANEILADLESQGSNFSLQTAPPESSEQPARIVAPHPVLEALGKLKVEQMSPIDAITKLYELQRLAQNGH